MQTWAPLIAPTMAQTVGLPTLHPLLGDAVDVAGVQQHLPGAHAHHLVVRPIRLLQRLNRQPVCLSRSACTTRAESGLTGELAPTGDTLPLTHCQDARACDLPHAMAEAGLATFMASMEGKGLGYSKLRMPKRSAHKVTASALGGNQTPPRANLWSRVSHPTGR